MIFSIALRSIEQWFNTFLLINMFLVVTITIATLCILMIISYGINQFFNKFETNTIIYEEISLFIILLSTLLFLQITFIAFKVDIDQSTARQLRTLYSNAQLIILFYCLYIVHRKIVLFFSMALPIYVYGSSILRHQVSFNISILVPFVILFITTWSIYNNNMWLIDSSWYYGSQFLFGITWWSILRETQAIPHNQVFFLALEFMVMMTIIHFGNIEVRSMIKHYLNLEKDSFYDGLTGIRNRRSFDTIIDEVFKFYVNKNLPVTMVMFDIDHFKLFNDQYGHQVGDRVLQHVANLFSKELLQQKMNAQFFRVGGEEFAIVFRNRTPTEVKPTVSAIRNMLVKHPFEIKDGSNVHITISMGVTQLQEFDTSAEDFYRRTDKYLYQAKNNNRNSISVEGNISSLN